MHFGLTAAELRELIGREQVELAKIPRTLARWSFGVASASWVFEDIEVPQGDVKGLFASLNQDARESLSCLSQIPPWIPLVLGLFSLYMSPGAFYTAARAVLVGDSNSYRLVKERGAYVNSQTRVLGRTWRLWRSVGWWLCAATSGSLAVAVTGLLLSISSNNLLIWIMVAFATRLIRRVEDSLTVASFSAPLVPDEATARRRLEEWQRDHPEEVETGMPLIYAYSGLTAGELRDQFTSLGSSGPAGLTGKVYGFTMVALIYSSLPAPSVEGLRQSGLIGCFFVNAHGFAGVAEDNIGTAMVAGLILVAILPISLLLTYYKFMLDYRFPGWVRRRVLAYEQGFAMSLPFFAVMFWTVLAVALALLLWLSAYAAVQSQSPLLGVITLAVPVNIFLAVWFRSKKSGSGSRRTR